MACSPVAAGAAGGMMGLSIQRISPMTVRLVAALVVTTALAAPAAAADLTVTDVQIAEALYGSTITAAQLKGSVVFVEEWGIH